MEPSRKEPIISFVPVNVSSRHDGWTAERQIAFIGALAETACVEEACRAVGMSASSAYRLRRSPRGTLFREAWDSALDYALHRLEQAALSRALNGVPRPVFYKGDQVGEWREYDERLTLFLLSERRRGRFGKWMRQLPEVSPSQEEADEDLDEHLDRIEFHADFFTDEDAPTSSRVEE